MPTPNLALPEMPSGSFQPSVPFNEAMQKIDALLPLAVLDKDLASPPTTVAGDAGKRWIVAASPTGAWAGHAGDIALCVGANLWLFISPPAYVIAYVIDEALDYRRVGSAWVLA